MENGSLVSQSRLNDNPARDMNGIPPDGTLVRLHRRLFKKGQPLEYIVITLTIIASLLFMFISHGEISPKEIEAVINQIDGVAESSVVGVQDEKWGEKIVAAVVKKSDSDVNIDDITSNVQKTPSRLEMSQRS
jgi:hypothetical protein